MRYLKFILAFILLPTSSFSQIKTFEIFGTITGDYSSKMYLFFEGNYRQKDSISSEIKNGKFYFKGKVNMPIQARLHMGQKSFIQDVYIDNNKTSIQCLNKMDISNSGQDTMNMLSIVSVNGSATEQLKTSFEGWLKNLKNSKVSDEKKRDAYYQKLFAFINQHPKSRVSPYLLGRASLLFYSQVKELSTLLDTSLKNSFETKSVPRLLKQLDKSGNYATGVEFKDFIFKDSSGVEIDTRKFRGKYTLIVCWASWCKPCREEHPDLNSLYEKYKSKGFEMIGISLDKDKQKWRNAIVKDQLNWKQVIDLKAFDGEMARYYGIEAIPANFLLNKEGKIIRVGLTPREIEEIIEKAL